MPSQPFQSVVKSNSTPYGVCVFADLQVVSFQAPNDITVRFWPHPTTAFTDAGCGHALNIQPQGAGKQPGVQLLFNNISLLPPLRLQRQTSEPPALAEWEPVERTEAAYTGPSVF